MKYTTNDGWDLESIRPLAEAVESYEEMSSDIYELQNCIRTRTLVQMRDSLLKKARDMIDALEYIDDDDTVEEEVAE